MSHEMQFCSLFCCSLNATKNGKVQPVQYKKGGSQFFQASERNKSTEPKKYVCKLSATRLLGENRTQTNWQAVATNFSLKDSKLQDNSCMLGNTNSVNRMRGQIKNIAYMFIEMVKKSCTYLVNISAQINIHVPNKKNKNMDS